MARHIIKILPKYLEAIIMQKKKFELRKNDRDYKVGDNIIFNEHLGAGKIGTQYGVRIIYILKDCKEYGLMDGFVIIGFE